MFEQSDQFSELILRTINALFSKFKPFFYVDNFISSQNFARRALATSNIESDNESINDKPRKRPRLKKSIEQQEKNILNETVVS